MAVPAGAGSFSDALVELESSPAEDSARTALIKLWALWDVARGGADIHARNFIHVDIKPDNVLLLASDAEAPGHGAWRAAICDGNLARKLPIYQGYLRGNYGGTPWFKAPEQLMGTHTSRRCDRFAFGAMLYRALTGRNFGRDRDRALSRSVASDWENTYPEAAYLYEPPWALLDEWEFEGATAALVALTKQLLHHDPCQPTAIRARGYRVAMRHS